MNGSHGHKPLKGMDGQVLTAAIGWLELGDHNSAFEETQGISHEHINHPDVLQVRFGAFAAGLKFDACLVVAKAMMTFAPSWRNSVLHYCRAMHWTGDSETAYQVLLGHADSKVWDSDCNYDLACYAAKTGRDEEAEKLLQAAFEHAVDEKSLKAYALDDPDLESLWLSASLVKKLPATRSIFSRKRHTP